MTVEAFALFNVFYQAGILLGPLVGLALTAVDFRLTCLVAATVFAALTVLQIGSLPARGPGRPAERTTVLADWREVFGNGSFVLFALAMIGCYVLSFQVYLALPLQARHLIGGGAAGTAFVAALFVITGGMAVAGQLRVTGWCAARWGSGRSLVIGLVLMAAAFLPPAMTGSGPTILGLLALALSAALLALGTIVVFPFEMDTIVALAGNRLVGTYYGLYNTVVGVGILLGNLLNGVALDLARTVDLPALPWLGLTLIGVLCAWSVRALDAAGHLRPASVAVRV